MMENIFECSSLSASEEKLLRNSANNLCDALREPSSSFNYDNDNDQDNCSAFNSSIFSHSARLCENLCETLRETSSSFDNDNNQAE
ncbi:MAG: hypothetical protein JXA03_01850 [Bacteroidales bacterium]|nr:hypothetical protein [Bacteroidales bacterium]